MSFALLFAAMLLLLGGCSASGREYAGESRDAGNDAGSVRSTSTPEQDAGSDAGTVRSTSTQEQDAGSDVASVRSTSTQQQDAGSDVASVRSTSTPEQDATSGASSSGTSSSAGVSPCSAIVDECETGTRCSPETLMCELSRGERVEGATCESHDACARGLACGFIGDPQWHQLACLRLGRVEADCGGALGRLVFGVGLTSLSDSDGTELGLCVGDIR